ncbi:D-beta-hydroxybutyrate dehydrogenase, mitochondrial [Planococcus citri]|uniref:D-beta-hydroxybutyrate dehydrogenase, mitochondrial n=1 Tax=Planococcus citri TaxID=170843 RepID=UPI0031F98294
MKRRESLKPAAKKTDELPWDFFDRCLLPIIFSHAAAIVVSFVLNILRISQISSFSLFIIFVLATVSVTICYHNLQVSTAGKAVLITSCDNNVGYALARQLDDLGFTVYAGFAEKNKAAKLKEESSARLHILQLNVTSDSDIKAAYDYVHKTLPSGVSGLWAIVNNTTWAAFGEFEWLPIDVYKQSIDINLTSVIKLTQIFLPSIRRTRGRIVNVSSITGRIPSELRSSLCTVKAAIEAFSECLRMELKKWSVNVIVVEPGTYTTGCWFDDQKILSDARNMWRRMSDDVRKHCTQDYFEFKVRSLPEYENAEKEINVLPTVRSLTDAVYKTFPLPRYTPITKQEKLQIFAAQHLPAGIYQILYS